MAFESLVPKTKDEVVELLKILSRVTSFEDAKNHFPPKLYDEVLIQQKQNSSSFEVVSKSIKQYLNSMNSIKVYIPFVASRQFIDEILKYFSHLPNSYVELIVDQSIIGGVRVVISGRVFDESLDTIIDKTIAASLKSHNA